MARVEPGAPARAQARLGLGDPLRQRALGVERLAVPGHLRGAGHQVHVGPALVQQGRALQRGLPGADDRHPLPGQGTQVGVLGAVGAQRAGQVGQHPRHPGEVLDARRQHDVAGHDVAAVGQAEVEAAVPARSQAGDHDLLQARHQLVGEPLAVADERVQRDGQAVAGVRVTGLGAERVQRVAAPGVGQVRGEALRLEEHAARHGLAPQPHGQPELPAAHAGPAQVRGGGQPVRSGPHDGDVDWVTHARASSVIDAFVLAAFLLKGGIAARPGAKR